MHNIRIFGLDNNDSKGLVIPEAIGTFLVCLVVGKELAE